MELYLLEHDPYNFSRTNITIWAQKRGHELHQIYVCKHQRFPSIDDLDWLMEALLDNMEEAWRQERAKDG